MYTFVTSYSGKRGHITVARIRVPLLDALSAVLARRRRTLTGRTCGNERIVLITITNNLSRRT